MHLKRSKDFSNPRLESIKEYTEKIGISYEETISKINNIKKIY